MGENKKVTTMVLKVDLQCEKCYRKVKKVLCKFPQIRDQTYDEKKNQVTIKVVSCSPEKIRDKLYCKGRCLIKSIDIIEPPPSSPPSVTCTCPPVTCKCPPVPPRVKWLLLPVNTCCTECYRGHLGGPCQTGCGYRQCGGYCGWRSYITSSYCVTRTNCFYEENLQVCAIM